MPTDAMPVLPNLEDFISKHYLRFSPRFYNSLTSGFTKFIENLPAEVDTELAVDAYLKVYIIAAESFFPSESLTMRRLYSLYHCSAIGQRIAKQRELLGISQKELAQSINRPICLVKKFERGEVDFGICFLELIAMKLHTSISVLLGLDEPTPLDPTFSCNSSHTNIDNLDHVLEEEKDG